MNALPVILIYLIIALTEVFYMNIRKQKREIVVYIMMMLIAMVLSINIAVGTQMESIATITEKIFVPILKQFQEM